MVLVPVFTIKSYVVLFTFAEQKCSAKFTQEIKEVRAKEGTKVKFEAKFEGNPPPEVTWEKDGKLLENSSEMQIKIKDNRTTLTIFECKPPMNGFYTCRCKNNLGSDRTRGSLTVQSK